MPHRSNTGPGSRFAAYRPQWKSLCKIGSRWTDLESQRPEPPAEQLAVVEKQYAAVVAEIRRIQARFAA